MSLKAKIEAVIYASEEPVTLVQLAGLLGHEAQAELDHIDSAQQALALENEASNGSESESRPSTPTLSAAISTPPQSKKELTSAPNASPLQQRLRQ